MRRITYYFSPVSPFVYLAGNRLEEVAARHGALIDYRPVDPTALFARTGGVPLAERHESRKAYRLQELRRQAKKLGMPINVQPVFWPVNPAPAAYAIIAADRAGGGDTGALAQSLARACWAEDRNIADDAVIHELLAKAGFDPKVADRGILTAAETYADNLEDAVAQGAFGVPFYITGDERFWGQDHIEDLDLHLSGTL